MSKQYESKKEAVSLINKAYSDNITSASAERKISEIEKKYNILRERTNKLEKVYQFHKGIIQNISSGIITVDNNGNITFINQAALKIIEYNFADLIETKITRLFVDTEQAEEILHSLLKKKIMFESKEVNLLTKSNKILPIGFSTSILNSKESVFEGVILSFRDLTELRGFRKEIERMDRLATLGEVSAGIAHEIRNPLAGIKTSAQVLEESFAPNDFRAQLVSRIVKEIDRSNDLLKRFFKFAKPGRPEQEFINIEKLVEGVRLLLGSRMKKKRIKYVANYDHLVQNVYIDESQIEQVIINLMLNAIDSIEEKGEITVNTGIKNQIDKQKSDYTQNMIFVEIEDTGKGISEDNIEKIFNPFFTTKNNGVGLGLAISSRLIEENGGNLEVKSKTGHGTKFILHFPDGQKI